MKSSLAGVPLKNRFSAVTDTVRFSHAGRLGASTMLVGWSTVPLNNIGELLLFTSTKYLKVWFPPGGIPVALSIKAIQEMTAVTGVVSSALMSTVRPEGASGGPENKDDTLTVNSQMSKWWAGSIMRSRCAHGECTKCCFYSILGTWTFIFVGTWHPVAITIFIVSL